MHILRLLNSLRLASSRSQHVSLTSWRCNSNQVPIEGVNESELIRCFTSPEGRPIVAGRPYLAGAHGAGMPPYLPGPRKGFPKVVDMTELTSTETVSKDLAATVKTVLRKMLANSGAILVKGLPLKSAHDMATFNNYLGIETMRYESGLGVRETVESDVLTASREPPCYTIEPHNEMSYLPKWPTHILFFCEIPPKPGCGGESVLVANREFQADLDPDVKEKFKRLGIRYESHLPSSEHGRVYLSWQEVFQTEDSDTAERIMSGYGYSYKWQSNGSLTYWYCLPATRPHHTTGEEIWFNQGHFNVTYFRSNPFWASLDIPDDEIPFNTQYGDGSDIEPEVLQHLREITWKHAIGLQLQLGEFVVLDNMLVQHGRLGYVGDRRLLVTLISSMNFSD